MNRRRGDHGGLKLRFVDFDLVGSSFCPFLLVQMIIGQRWPAKWAKWWRNSQMEDNAI